MTPFGHMAGTRRGLILTVALALVPAAQAVAQDMPAANGGGAPLSAIDWLSQSVEVPVAAGTTGTTANSIPDPDEPPVADGAASPDITVTALDDAALGPIGTLPRSLTGLPADLWTGSDPETLVTLIRAEPEPALPALRSLLVTLLLTQADAPAGDARSLLLTRIDKLLDLANLTEAEALIRAAGRTEPDLFRRWFDVALLMGTEDAPCGAMQTAPGLAPTLPARIFCMARGGDWMAAALTLNTYRALGDVSAEEEALLSRFLDAGLVDPDAPLPPPDRISPLIFRLREAIGEGLATQPLPLAFARADLRTTVGEKARLDAAERLSLHGALSGPMLAAVMADVTPAASGGVWDRLDAYQQFDAALRAADAAAVSATLPAAWDAMTAIRAEVTFADLHAMSLSQLDLTGDAATLAVTIRLLSDNFASAGPAATDPVLRAVATGDFTGVEPVTAMEMAVVAGFADTHAPEPYATQLANGQVGEALLRIMPVFEAGVAGDARSVSDALRVLHHAGLQDTARRAALQLLLLDRTP